MSPSGRGLVCVSNRIPIRIFAGAGGPAAEPSSGGLVRALQPVLKEFDGAWVGAAGEFESPQAHRLLEDAARGLSYRFAPLFLDADEDRRFYQGFSNEILWPLFHDLQSRCNFDPSYWEVYRRVNERFALAAEKAARPGDIIWIHDYQLMQVARTLRRRGVESPLAFFLHIPFPSPDIFGKLPWRREILEGLLEHDLIGVQTQRDERNLIACLRAFLPQVKITGREGWRSIVGGARPSRIRSFPIGIDYEEFAAPLSAAIERGREIRAKQPDRRILVGVDRLDYTKGVPERLKAFRAFLRRYPEFHRQVELIQIVVPSREGIPGYLKLKAELERLAAQVNGEFGEPGWIPVNYLHRPVTRNELIAIYRAADVALVTPLKDGMNLVAKEYCAAKTDADGVLVLSEFAGAAAELRVGAVLVNPYDEFGTAAALKQALEMPRRERLRRMRRMRDQVRQCDIHKWRGAIFAALEEICKGAAAVPEPWSAPLGVRNVGPAAVPHAGGSKSLGRARSSASA
jgi:trehalose 6-phosphate synthase